MKKCFILMSLFAMTAAHANVARKEDRFLKCVRKVVQSRRADDESIKKIYEVLKEFKQEKPEVLLDSCEEIVQEIKDQPKRDKKAIENAISATVQNDQTLNAYAAQRTLKKMISPSMKCHIEGVQADAALGFGIEVGLKTGGCRSQDGHHYGMFFPSIGATIGGGALVLFTHKKFTIWNDERVTDDSGHLLGGMLIAFDEEDGIGLGFGLILGGAKQLNLKVLPLGNNFDDIKSDFKSLE